MVIVRNDRYELDEENRTIYLKDFKLTLKFKGKLKWRGKQGRLEIIYNEARISEDELYGRIIRLALAGFIDEWGNRSGES
jgi:hypothetical protein